jgi:Thioredoxin-like [2Fe-2S] ferredoxin
MSKQHQKHIRPLTGQFRGWGDSSTPHRYIQLATVDGDLLIKIAKSLRPYSQDWQPGIYLTLLTQETIDRDTGERKIKVKQLVSAASIEPDRHLPNGLSSLQLIDPLPIASQTLVPSKIQVCQGSSCRRRGSKQICDLMQADLDQYQLAEQVEIESVKCLHHCKAGPHAIIISPTAAMVPGKTHYRQIQSSQVLALLAKHFPIVSPLASNGSNLIEKIGAYLQQQHHLSSTATTLQAPG